MDSQVRGIDEPSMGDVLVRTAEPFVGLRVLSSPGPQVNLGPKGYPMYRLSDRPPRT